MFSFLSQIRSSSASSTFVFEFKMKSKLNKQTKISRANQYVLYFLNQKQNLWWDGCLPLSKMTFVEFLPLCICIYIWVCANVRVIHMPLMPVPQRLRVSTQHLCELEKYLVSFKVFSAVKPVSEEILNSSARTVVDVPQSKAFSFSYPSFPFSLFPCPCPCDNIWGSQHNRADCMVRFQLRVKRYYTYHIIRLALQNNIFLRNGNMTTCPTDALKDNQSNPYPEGRKPKPKYPSSVSKLISLFWKKGSNSRICISLHERKSALCNSFIFLWNQVFI